MRNSCPGVAGNPSSVDELGNLAGRDALILERGAEADVLVVGLKQGA